MPKSDSQPVQRLEDDLLFSPVKTDGEYLERLRKGRYLASLVFMERALGEASFICKHFCSRYKSGSDKCEHTLTGCFPVSGYCDSGFDLIEATLPEYNQLVLLSWVSGGSLNEDFSMQPAL